MQNQNNANAKDSEKTIAAVETGHAKNVANFERLTIVVSGYGVNYNPSKTAIKLATMQATLTAAKQVVSGVNSMVPASKNAIVAREEGFERLTKLVPRITAAINLTDAPQSAKDNVRTVVRKLQGRRAKAKKTEEEIEQLKAEGNEPKYISVSQMSYDNRLDNFDKLIAMLTSIPEYSPNEPELKVTGLTNFRKELIDKNLAAEKANVTVKNARIARDKTLYQGNANIAAIANDCKLYIKSVFGPSSVEYKQVSKLKFKSRA